MQKSLTFLDVLEAAAGCRPIILHIISSLIPWSHVMPCDSEASIDNFSSIKSFLETFLAFVLVASVDVSDKGAIALSVMSGNFRCS